MFDWIADPQAWIALATLTALEVVLGIDNVIFISILSGRLPEHQQQKARKVGLAAAMLMRVGLLFSLSWIMRLEAALFTAFEEEISGRDLILIVGGLFLIGKSTVEIHHRIEEAGADRVPEPKAATFGAVVAQVMLLDIVFSLDSVITAVGMVEHLAVMVIAVLISVAVMIAFVDSISAFVERHPTFKVLALSFLVLIGVALLGDGLGLHIPKGYIYFAMAFSAGVEFVNLKIRSARRAGR
jgi:predicted tellurium resistance membrane protein TerC